MLPEAPLVSVVVRSMDPPTLARALASVAAQDYPALEVVLVAACGPAHRPVDASRYPFRLNYVASAEPLSRPRAANAGMDAAQGALVTVLDHDDEFLPGHVAGLAAALAANPDAGAAYCRFEVLEQGRLVTTVGRKFHRLALHEKSYIHHSALMFRRDLLATGVRYDTALDIHDDWDFVLQLSERTRFVFVDQTTFRWHADIGTSGGGGVGNFDPVKFDDQRHYVRSKWAPVFAAHVDRYNAAVEQGMAAMQRGALDEAARHLQSALDTCQDDPDLLNALAMIRNRQGDHEAARQLVGEAAAARPGDARLWFNYGISSASCARDDDARAAFRRVLDLEPGHPGATQWLSRLPA
jgi:tetratricopeptide (TPR) repeat protein